jgi:hypothetical protein
MKAFGVVLWLTYGIAVWTARAHLQRINVCDLPGAAVSFHTLIIEAGGGCRHAVPASINKRCTSLVPESINRQLAQACGCQLACTDRRHDKAKYYWELIPAGCGRSTILD